MLRMLCMLMIAVAISAVFLIGFFHFSQRPAGLNLLILAGQSNVRGRGELAAIPPEVKKAFSQVWVYNDTWHRGRVAIDNPDGEKRPILVDKARIALAGPGISLGIEQLKKGPTGIVTCAKGSTSSAQWLPLGELFEACLSRVRSALAHGRLVGLVYYQGESNRKTNELTRSWSAHTQEILKSFRERLGLPDLKIVLVGLGEHGEIPLDQAENWKLIQHAQRTLRFPRLAYVSAEGLPLNKDGIHLTTGAQLKLGAMISRALNELQ